MTDRQRQNFIRNNNNTNYSNSSNNSNPYGTLEEPQLGKPYVPQNYNNNQNLSNENRKVPRNQGNYPNNNNVVRQNQGYVPPQNYGNPYNNPNQNNRNYGVVPNHGNMNRNPPQQEQPQRVIIIQQQNLMACKTCGYDGPSTVRTTAGCVVFAWCICLFLFFPIFCWVPFCVQSCKDTQVVCNRCGQVKGVVEGNCCC